jgi:SseB protein C-terminal domain
MEAQKIEAGTEILIGAPAERMPQAQSAAIAGMLARVGGVREAHLPQCFVPGAMEEPGQVLVLALERGADAEALMNEIGCQLAQMLPEGQRLDVWPVPADSGLLRDVRAAGCQILGPAARAKPWWRFW